MFRSSESDCASLPYATPKLIAFALTRSALNFDFTDTLPGGPSSPTNTSPESTALGVRFSQAGDRPVSLSRSTPNR